MLRFMIACDYCGGWYHGSCVGVSEDAATLLETYKCPACLAAGVQCPFYTEG